LNKAEIVIYKDIQNADFQIDVRVEDETVWLNRQQMADLFSRDIKTIGKHINNALREELKSIPVIAKFATTGPDRKGDIPHSLASIAKAEKMMGYKPEYNFEKGLKLAVEWYRKNLK
jgi:nucleoside-diphosphate-sugar epimerase